MKARAKSMVRGTWSMIVALGLCLGLAGAAVAQQGEFKEIPSNPGFQSQGGGVLEVPTVPAPQTGSVDTLPQHNIPAPQTGELTIPPHELRSQQGYAQTTVTVTDQDGRYITGLQKSDFRLYVDGTQRKIDF